MVMQGRPDHLQRAALLPRLPGAAQRAALPAVADGRGGDDGAPARRAGGVPLLLVPPRAAPPLPLLPVPLAPPRIHRHRANHM
jgi:hypothetical protein